MAWRGLPAALLAATLAGPVAGQTTQVEVPPPILTIDGDRLLEDSAFGRQLSREFESRARDLAAENRQIEEELVAEERDLTERRDDLPPEEFRTLADAFDAKVQMLRQRQDQKERELTQSRDAERQRFFQQVAPVLSEIVRERGALVILDRRNVFLSADSIDITDEAIRRFDERLEEASEPAGETGTGSAPEKP
jgi:Skp family chaperone for outer membrane proteins